MQYPSIWSGHFVSPPSQGNGKAGRSARLRAAANSDSSFTLYAISQSCLPGSTLKEREKIFSLSFRLLFFQKSLVE